MASFMWRKTKDSLEYQCTTLLLFDGALNYPLPGTPAARPSAGKTEHCKRGPRLSSRAPGEWHCLMHQPCMCLLFLLLRLQLNQSKHSNCTLEIISSVIRWLWSTIPVYELHCHAMCLARPRNEAIFDTKHKKSLMMLTCAALYLCLSL
jgi:hypothetical protein